MRGSMAGHHSILPERCSTDVLRADAGNAARSRGVGSSCSVSAGVELQKTALGSRTARPLERAKDRIANVVVDNLFAAVIEH
jgi:hypothetical protein